MPAGVGGGGGGSLSYAGWGTYCSYKAWISGNQLMYAWERVVLIGRARR